MIHSPEKIALVLLLLLAASPTLAAQTAIVRGTPQTHTSPSLDAPLTGKNLPEGATVTLEQCSGLGLGGATTPGLQAPAPGAGDWCLVRGVGWVEATALVNITADPRDLFPGTDWLDQRQDASPAWDDLTE